MVEECRNSSNCMFSERQLNDGRDKIGVLVAFTDGKGDSPLSFGRITVGDEWTEDEIRNSIKFHGLRAAHPLNIDRIVDRIKSKFNKFNEGN